MPLTIVTGWSPEGWTDYAHRFVESFYRFWPSDVRCVAYVEDDQQLDRPRGREHAIELRSVLEIEGSRAFLEKYRHDARANGRAPTPQWKPAWRDAGYCFRFDAWKFSRQGFIPLHAARLLRDDEMLCWLDADVVTHTKVPAGFVESLLPSGKAVAYLGRGDKHSEIGFQLYRLPAALPLLVMFSDSYRCESVFRLREWHSAFVFDHARVASRVPGHDLTPGGSGRVFEASPLGRYMTHLKGDRKYTEPSVPSNYLRMQRR